MSDNPLAKFLPKKDDTNPTLDLIERANSQFSCIDILNKEFGYSIPYGGSGSTKLACIWGWEHKDGGVEKCMRYYWETDQAFCFRDHGIIDVVAIRASQKGLSKSKTAKKLLYEAGLLGKEPWQDRIKKAQENLQETHHSSKYMNMNLAEQMFNESLRSVENYATLQFKPLIVQTKNEILEELDPSWSLDELTQWLEKSKQTMRATIEEWQRKT